MAAKRDPQTVPDEKLDDSELRQRIERVLEEADSDQLGEKINPKKCGLGAFPASAPSAPKDT